MAAPRCGVSSATPMFSCKPIGRDRSRAEASVPRRLRCSARALCTAHCRLTAISGRGLRAAASIPWCRRQPASMSRKRKPPESKGQRNCRVRRSIMPAVICSPLACSWRACARRAKAEAGWCVFRSQLPGVGSGLLGRVGNGFSCPLPSRDDVADLLEESRSPFGLVRGVRHAAKLSATPAGWTRPAVPLGTDPPIWPSIEKVSGL